MSQTNQCSRQQQQAPIAAKHSTAAGDYRGAGESDHRDQSNRCRSGRKKKPFVVAENCWSSKAASGVLGAGAQSIAARHFTEIELTSDYGGLSVNRPGRPKDQPIYRERKAVAAGIHAPRCFASFRISAKRSSWTFA